MRFSAVFLISTFVTLSQAPVYGQDADTASERERLGNQRAMIEAERRARESEAELAVTDESRPVEAAPKPVADTEPAAPLVAPVPASSVRTEDAGGAADAGERTEDIADVSQILEQLRELGELRDAGYITPEEFDRIKARILQGRL